MFDNMQCFSRLGRGFLWKIYVDFIDTEIYKHCSCFILT